MCSPVRAPCARQKEKEKERGGEEEREREGARWRWSTGRTFGGNKGRSDSVISIQDERGKQNERGKCTQN